MQKHEKKIQTYSRECLDEYLKIKKVQIPVFGGLRDLNLEDEELRQYLFSIEFLSGMCEIIAQNYLKGFLNSEVKNNIYDIIMYLKTEKPYSSKTEKESLFEELNEMICTLNNSSEHGMYSFYRKQLCDRTYQKLTKFWEEAYDEEFLNPKISSINYSISCDYDAIRNLAEVDDEDFFKEVVPDNLISHWYINTLNILFTEFPELYTNKVFLERAKFILKNNIALIKNRKSAYELTCEDLIDDDILYRTRKVLKRLKKIGR